MVAASRSQEPAPATPAPGFGRTLALAVGVVCGLELALDAFMAPGVVARWFSDSHPLVHLLLAASWAAALALHGRLERTPLLVLTLVFAALLGVALWLHQPALPADASGYPFEAPPPTTIARIVARVTLALSGVVPLALAALVGEIGAAPPGARKLGGAFAIGGVVLLFSIAAQILTSIYDYVPVVGPLLRDRFWLVTAVPALGLAAALAAVRNASERHRVEPAVPALVVALGAAATALSVAGEPDAGAQPRAALRVVSYNIQQGYTKDARDDLDAQLAVLRGLDADVIGLSECDTSRLAGGNDDIVRYLARKLGMYVHHGPTPAAGTFGVALLSRSPIVTARTFYLYSVGEQTALVVAELAGGRRVAATHLGNDGPIIQLENTLAALQDQGLVMGDFNFVADSLQYAQTVQTLDDAWQIAAQHEGERLVGDLDHLFVSRGTRVASARYVREDASDHPALLVELAPP
jgi:endonuclease/exonuclease/phosphatase family metal-dependent hydrolase